MPVRAHLAARPAPALCLCCSLVTREQIAAPSRCKASKASKAEAAASAAAAAEHCPSQQQRQRPIYQALFSPAVHFPHVPPFALPALFCASNQHIPSSNINFHAQSYQLRAFFELDKLATPAAQSNSTDETLDLLASASRAPPSSLLLRAPKTSRCLDY
ncbi:hypothetical protein VTJ04DRAFT_9713 [Mycothermus thermophilus]|uniref:uncharacterized protein n=1 Tax=Humicola insolens TaxID=85995 RepID=UPI003742ED74